MNHTITTSAHPPDTYAAASCARADVGTKNELLRMFVAWLAERALKRAEDDLQRLDDRALKDIGLTRSEISSVLRELVGDRLHFAGLFTPRHC